MRESKSPGKPKTIVVALGGNAILSEGQSGTAEQQMGNLERACRYLMPLIQAGHHLVITHGNGPQVGNLAIQQEESQNLVPMQPLDLCVAMTQGQIGAMLQQALDRVLKEAGIRRDIVVMLSHFVVGADDPDFEEYSKPIGPFLTAEQKEAYESQGHVVREVEKGKEHPYRRVVPSPIPLRLLERRAIRSLSKSGAMVIAAGGGGIPVVLGPDGSYQRIEAVIDKDLAGEKLAESVDADIYLVLTNVAAASINYGTGQQQELRSVTLQQAKDYYREGHFARGSMGPKVLGCIQFLEFGGERAIITGLEQAESAIAGQTGTHFIPG
jgi:carbamate kinase